DLPRFLVVAPGALGVRLRLGAVAGVPHECPELAARHLILAQIKVARNLHTVLILVAATLLLARRRSHLKLACLDPHQLHRDAIAEVQYQHPARAAPCLPLLVIVERLFLLAAGRPRSDLPAEAYANGEDGQRSGYAFL